MYGTPDQNIFFLRDVATHYELGSEFFVMNLDSTKSEMAPNLMIVHWRTQLLGVSKNPQSCILH